MVKDIKRRVREYFFGHIIMVLSVLFVVSTAIISGFMWYQFVELNKLDALEHGRQLTDALAEFRTLYTSKVVSKAKNFGMKITHDYHHKKNALPLPATMSMELGTKIGGQGSGAKSFLYSPYPFPWRKKTGGLKDMFQQKAWKHLSSNPKQPFYRFETYKNNYSLRYATSDLMRSSCVSCHNTHPQTPKSNWKQGDVRGILEVVIPMNKVYEKTLQKLVATFLLMLFIGGLGLGALALVIGKLRRTSQELEQKVEQRTKELATEKQSIANLLNNMHQAVFAVDSSRCVVPPVSEHSQRVFGTAIEGKQISDILYKYLDVKSDAYSKIDTVLHVVFGEDELQWDMIQENLPQKITYKHPSTKEQRILRVSHSAIWNEEELLDKILYVIEDITDIERLEQEIVLQKQESSRNIQILQELASLDIPMLKDFFLQSLDLLEQVEILSNKLSKDPSKVHELFRLLHTLKGNARMLKLSLVVTVAHHAENSVSNARNLIEQGKSLQQEQIQAICAEIKEVRPKLTEYSSLAKKVFKIESGFGSNASLPKMVPVMESHLLQLQNFTEPLPSQLQEIIKNLAKLPVAAIALPFRPMIDELAQSLDKKIQFIVQGEDTLVSHFKLTPLQEILLHMLQNAIDHGLETEQQRKSCGKKSEGLLQLNFKRAKGKLFISVEDDGRGIDKSRVVEKAIEKKITTKEAIADLSEEQQLSFIFHPGMSTLEEATEISGRGVGLDVVNTNIEKLEASISIKSQLGTGTCFTIEVKD